MKPRYQCENLSQDRLGSFWEMIAEVDLCYPYTCSYTSAPACTPPTHTHTCKHTKSKDIWVSRWRNAMWKDRQNVKDEDSARQGPQGEGWCLTGFQVQPVSTPNPGQQEEQNTKWEATLMWMKRRTEADGTGHCAFMSGLLDLSLKHMTTSVVIITITQIAASSIIYDFKLCLNHQIVLVYSTNKLIWNLSYLIWAMKSKCVWGG